MGGVVVVFGLFVFWAVFFRGLLFFIFVCLFVVVFGVGFLWYFCLFVSLFHVSISSLLADPEITYLIK